MTRRAVLLLSAVLAVLTAVAGLPAGAATAPPTFTASAGGTLGDVLTAHIALVDDDDVPDLVTGVLGKGVAVELGRGDGTFRAPVLREVPGAAYNVSVGDVDRDGRTDVVVLTSAAPARAHVLLGTRDAAGTLRTGPVSAAPSGALGTALLDGDLDGDLDLAVPTTGSTTFLVNDGSGAFSSGPVVSTTGVSNVYAPVAASFNGDAHPDLVLPRHTRHVSVLLSTGTPFGYRLVTTSALSGLDVGVGQVDGDPVPEIAYASGSTVGLLSYDPGTRTFRDRPLSTSLTDALGAAVADIDGDGFVDVSTSSANRHLLLHGRGAGGFQAGTPGAPLDTSSYAQLTHDLTGDGWPDVVATSHAARRTTVLTNTSGQAGDRAPVVTAHPASAGLAEGERFALRASASAASPAEVVWQRLDGAAWRTVTGSDVSTSASGGSTSTTLQGTAARADDGAAYRAVFTVSGSDGRLRRASTDTALLAVRPASAPSFTTGLSDVTLREGTTGSLSVVPAGDPRPAVSWEVQPVGAASPTPLQGSSATLSLPAVPLSYDGALLRVTLTNHVGTASSSARLTVDPLPRVTSEPVDTVVRAGTPARFSVSHSGGGTARWEVSRDSGATWSAAGSGDTLDLPSPPVGANGSRYRAVLVARGSSPAPTVTSRAALLTVTDVPAAPTAVSATAVGQRVTVRWQPPAGASGLTGYAVTLRGLTSEHGADVREVVLPDVPDGVHTVTVRALDASGEGAPATVNVTTPGSTATPTSTPSASPSPSRSGTPSPSASPSASPSGSPRTTPSPGTTPSRTPTPTPTPTATRSATPAPTGSTPTARATSSPTRTPAGAASPRTASPRPSASTPTGTTPRPTTTAAPRPGATPAGTPVPTTLPSSPADLVPDATTGELKPLLRTLVPRIDGGKKSTIIGLAAPGTKLELLAYVRPSTEYKVVRTATADAQGAFTFTTVPSGNMRAHVRTAAGTLSDSVVQEVRPWLGLTAKALKGRSYSFTGSVTPRRPGQLVTLYVQTKDGRKLLANARADAKGVYYDEHVFTRPGTYRVVAVARRDLVTFEASSPVRAVTVTR